MPLPFQDGVSTGTKTRSLSPKGKRRARLLSGTKVLTYPYGTNQSVSTQVADFSAMLKGVQVTVSENHPDWNSKKSSSGFTDIGGNFYTQKTKVEGPLTTDHKSSGSRTNRNASGVALSTDYYQYQGFMIPVHPSYMTWPAIPASSLTSLDALGATAIARCKPTNSVADLSTFLGETIKDGLPKLVGASFWKDKTITAKKAGSEYLNKEFGWDPMVQDILDIASAIDHAGEVIRQYERDSGRVVRRRFSFPPVNSVTSSVLHNGVNAWCAGPIHALMNEGVPQNQGKVILQKETSIRRWFSGAFTYWLPPSGTLAGEAARAKKLLGASLDPDTLWELAPWSWAVDWFSNAGDVISNMTDFLSGGLVLWYGYIMEHSISKHTYVFSGPTGYVGSTRPLSVSLVAETKIRKKATPFGFGLNWANFSPQQLAIVGALGISRT